MSDEILVNQDGPILRITLNRPDAGNGVTDVMAAELIDLLEEAPKTSRLVLLRGAGADFCTGRAGNKPPPTQPEALQRRRQTDVIFNCYGAFRRTPIPVVGVVQGRALGFGFSMAALCDITIASDAARFQIPEMSHKILPTMVMSSLVDRLPRKAINYLVHTSAVIGPERALTFGVVSEVVPAAELEEAVKKVCDAILACPAPATEGVKEYLRSTLTMDIQGAVDYARNLHATVNSSSEMKR